MKNTLVKLLVVLGSAVVFIAGGYALTYASEPSDILTSTAPRNM